MSGRNAGIGRHLREGEELIWTGSPLESRECARIDRLLLPLCGLFLALSTLLRCIPSSPGAFGRAT